MATLYKRYIPAKAEAERSAILNTDSQISAPESATPTPENKRKRERTQEEIVERKAKKLKKKGTDPETVEVEKLAKQDVKSIQDVSLASTQHGEAEDGLEQRLPMKKRHKLEKEARKARKAAERGRGAGENAAEAVEVSASSKKEISDVGVLITNGAESALDAGNEATYSTEDQAAKDREAKIKRKKRRKESEEPTSQGLGESDVISGAEVDSVQKTAIAEQPSEETSEVRKRRHKLEHVIEGADAEDEKTEDEEHLRKHTSVLGKFQTSARRAVQHQQEAPLEKPAEHQVVRDLELPPPERTPMPEFESEDAALPSWLAKPTVVTGHSKTTFGDLGLDATTADRLSKLGFTEALPVQQALVPLLLAPGLSGANYPPGTEAVLPDIAVSAPTGSGKTIAYLLPIIEALRHQRQHGKLTALIVVPTRELVMQVAAVAESLVKGRPIKVGMATGTSKFKDEQEKIVTRSAQYDPAGYKKLIHEATLQIHPPDEDSDEFQSYLDQGVLEDKKRQQWVQNAVRGLVDHVPKYDSAVDILVATPGRLLEHIDNTLGFNLTHLQWLAIDEADKLLDNQYEGFLETLNVEMTRPRTEEERDPREKFLRSQGLWDEHKERRPRKVVLSATMSRDISKLTSLNLQRPRMIVIRGGENSHTLDDGGVQGDSSVKENAGSFELPPTLVEYCVPVGDGSEKPLVVVELLKSKVFGDSHGNAATHAFDSTKAAKDDESSDADSDSGPDSESDSSSDESSSLSSDASDSSSSASDFDDSTDDDDDDVRRQSSPAPDSLHLRDGPSGPSAPRTPTVLIFTSSNESANRLSHLLRGLKPGWKSWITTLVKAKPEKARIRSKADEPAIVISTDRAARGLDSFSDRAITHVVQYDVPRTTTSYVHRVGRTARAGRDGDAWTLYTHAEARWFVNEITKAKNVIRRAPVERVKVFMADDGTRERYQTVLAGMRDEVFGGAN